MQKFVVRYLEVLFDEGVAKPQLGTIAADIQVDRATISQWRHHTTGFNEWFNALIDRAVVHARSRVTARLTQLAESGSLEHMKLFYLVTTPRIADAPPPGSPAGIFAGAVIVNLPLPPNELEGHTVVRGLIDQARTIDAVATGS
jgi:hypothetical protein